MLEKIIVDTLASYGVKSRGDRKNRGVWIGDAKIAAIGPQRLFTKKSKLLSRSYSVRVNELPGLPVNLSEFSRINGEKNGQ
jgi:hypothetical protein